MPGEARDARVLTSPPLFFAVAFCFVFRVSYFKNIYIQYLD